MTITVTECARSDKFCDSDGEQKETILEMASENALDDALVALLDQNIDGAKASGQDKARPRPLSPATPNPLRR